MSSFELLYTRLNRLYIYRHGYTVLLQGLGQSCGGWTHVCCLLQGPDHGGSGEAISSESLRLPKFVDSGLESDNVGTAFMWYIGWDGTVFMSS